MFRASAHITDFCSGALSSQDYEAGFAILESSGLVETFSRLAPSDEMQETARLERIVLFLGFVVLLFFVLLGLGCAPTPPLTLLSPQTPFPHVPCAKCRCSTPLSSLLATLRPLIVLIFGSLDDRGRPEGFGLLEGSWAWLKWERWLDPSAGRMWSADCRFLPLESRWRSPLVILETLSMLPARDPMPL